MNIIVHCTRAKKDLYFQQTSYPLSFDLFESHVRKWVKSFFIACPMEYLYNTFICYYEISTTDLLLLARASFHSVVVPSYGR